jgi:ASC-1-like (ASCH) protein
MAVIKKKIPPDFFELIKSGKKKFELRVADFKIKEGDTLVLEEWDSKKKKYTGRELKKKAGYILKFPFNKFGQKKLIEKHGLYVIQLYDVP